MLSIYESEEFLSRIQNRTVDSISSFVSSSKIETVQKIIQEVRKKGDHALIHYAKEWDQIQDPNFRIKVSPEEKEKKKEVPEKIRAVLNEAYENIYRYHMHQKQSSWHYNDRGAMLGQLIQPIEKVGVYVPGGSALYPSTVLMNCIPAQIAGVPEIYITTPPRSSGKSSDGTIDPAILYTAELCGVKKIFKVGGAGAISALAYGTETIPKVYKIVGPGNSYVTLAKKLVYGDVDLDMIAGPSEIMILADSNSPCESILFDLFSQSEHSPDASSIVLLPNQIMANQIQQLAKEKVQESKRKEILIESLSQNGALVIYSKIEEAYQIIREYAPEHLEILIDLPFQEITENIRNVGSIFLGEYTPEPVGDYFSGTNHNLPTAGTAKFFSCLGVYDFQRRSCISQYSKKRFMEDRNKIIAFAEYEGLFEHANSIRSRKK